MAKLSISEFRTMGRGGGGVNAQIPSPPLQTRVLDFSTGVASLTVGANTRFVSLRSDTNCYVMWGSTSIPTSTNSMPVYAGTPESVGIASGGTIAVST